MIFASSSSSGADTETYLKRLAKSDIRALLERVGEQGKNALAKSTPTRTGKTANSWYYEVNKTLRGWTINWYNSNVVDGTAVAILIQYGHGTGTGGWVPAIDYVNPAMQPIFDNVSAEIWREVTK